VAEAAGVNVQTLRYYERRGLLPEPERSLGGHRDWPPETVTLIAAIKAAQRLGFTLKEVTELLAAGYRRRPRPPLRERAAAKLVEIGSRIDHLVAIRSVLTDVIGAGCDDLTVCACHPDCPVPFTEIDRTPRSSEDRRPENRLPGAHAAL
jgi:DNA-binding transcriptional MerR regulator